MLILIPALIKEIITTPDITYAPWVHPTLGRERMLGIGEPKG